MPDEPWSDYVKGYLAFLAARVSDAEMLLARAWAAVEKDGAGDAAPPDLSVRIASLLAILAVVRLDYPAMLRFGNEAVEGRAL